MRTGKIQGCIDRKYNNQAGNSPLSSSFSWLARTDPRDVARIESKTVIVTRNQRETVPTPLGGGVSQLGRWMSPEDFDKAMAQRFPGCMKGTGLRKPEISETTMKKSP